MSNHDPMVRLLHMRDYAKKAIEIAANKTREDLHKEEMLRLALTRLLELIGEAASRYPRELQANIRKSPGQNL